MNNDPEPAVEERVIIPILQEDLQVEIREKVTSVVRLEKTVHESSESIDQDLLSQSFSVERVPVNEYIAEPVTIRQEGDTTIYPVMEEILIVTKQLVLREEIRVTRRQSQTKHQENVTLRSEQVSIQRLSLENVQLEQTSGIK